MTTGKITTVLFCAFLLGLMEYGGEPRTEKPTPPPGWKGGGTGPVGAYHQDEYCSGPTKEEIVGYASRAEALLKRVKPSIRQLDCSQRPDYLYKASADEIRVWVKKTASCHIDIFNVLAQDRGLAVFELSLGDPGNRSEALREANADVSTSLLYFIDGTRHILSIGSKVYASESNAGFLGARHRPDYWVDTDIWTNPKHLSVSIIAKLKLRCSSARDSRVAGLAKVTYQYKDWPMDRHLLQEEREETLALVVNLTKQMPELWLGL